MTDNVHVFVSFNLLFSFTTFLNNNPMKTQSSPPSILSKKAHQILTNSNTKKQDILHQASDVTLQANQDKKLQFTVIVIQSTATKRHISLELSVPWEERCQSTY